MYLHGRVSGGPRARRRAPLQGPSHRERIADPRIRSARLSLLDLVQSQTVRRWPIRTISLLTVAGLAADCFESISLQCCCQDRRINEQAWCGSRLRSVPYPLRCWKLRGCERMGIAVLVCYISGTVAKGIIVLRLVGHPSMPHGS